MTIHILDERGPTPERLQKAGNDYVVGGDERTKRIYCFQDSPLDQLFAKQKIESVAYRALMQLRFYWYCGGLSPSVRSVDLNRIWAPDFSSMSGMPKSERQAFYRKQYREAMLLLDEEAKKVISAVVCSEVSLEIAGVAMGYLSPYRARWGAINVLCKSGDRLARHWGMS